MLIKDAHGGEREYDPEKIVRSATRAGFGKQQARRIEDRVRERAWEGITTRKLHSIVFEEMEERDEASALRYRLRESIAELNPEFHEFEKFMTAVLEENGLEASWSPRPKPQGECVDHEIDIVAEEDDTTFIVECKHHYHHHRYSGLNVPMRQWARLQDLQSGRNMGYRSSMDADRAWVIVNTKISEHAKEYARCKDVRLTAWKYPEDGMSMDELVEGVDAYPVTMLKPPHHARVELSKRNILTVQDLLGLSDEEEKDLGLEKETLRELQRKAEDLID